MKTDYAVQAHQISRASYSMPVMQRRLVYLVMAQTRPGDDELPGVEMTVGDIIRALDLGDSGNRYEQVEAAIDGAMSRVLKIDTGDGWEKFNWFARCRFIKSRSVVKMQLHPDLKPYVLELQSAFSIVQIEDVAKLSGRHAQRLFELIMANYGMAGTGGNKPGCWFYDVEFAHLRFLLDIAPHEYKDTKNFRVRVIDGPIREINEAGLGIRVECDYERFRHGRRLLGVRLNCKALKKGDPRPVGPATKAEGEESALIHKYPDLYEKYLAEERQAPPMFGDPELYAQGQAVKRLVAHDKAQPRKARTPRAKE